jgi:vacuolar-type H+-ATPase subunit I/STV1
VISPQLALWLGGTIVCTLLAWSVQGLRLDALRAEHEAYVAQAQANAVLAEQARSETETRWKQEVENAEREAQERLAQAEKERADLARAAQRLRDDVAALRKRLADAPPAARLDADAALDELLGRCAEEYRRMAGAAERHADDVRTLISAWPR